MEKTIYLAAGCFWGAQHYLKQIHGVVGTQTGYANGHADREQRSRAEGTGPSYEEVYTDQTGYAETVRVTYQPEVLSLEMLVKLYFKCIDPLSVNQQGEDRGTRYRTGIYFTDPSDLPVVNTVADAVQQSLGQPLAVEIAPLKGFWAAETYHQDYLDKHPDGYCHLPVALFEMARSANKDHREEQKNSAE